MSLADRVAAAVTEHGAVVILVVLLVTVGLGAGVGQIEQSSSLDQFQSETTEAEKLDYVREHFRTGPQNTTTVQIVIRDDNVLDRESLLAQLRTVQRLQENETIAPTLTGPPTGVATLVATAALEARPGGPQGPATVEQQIAAVEAMNASQVDAVLARLLGGGDAGDAALGLMPRSYTPGSTTADATMLIVTQTTSDSSAASGSATETIVESQVAMQAIVHDELGTDSSVFGSGVITDEIDRSMTDSLLVVGPMALLFVLFVLIVAYRDVLDILLGLTGIGLVLVWTFGFMGWLGYAFNQLFVAIPVLLIGLAIDYAIHVFMRHREERERTGGARNAMRVALASVGVALFFVTATTVIGFLSNLISDVPPIREFGVVAAFGIVAAFVIFGGLVPAVKVLTDSFLERRGFDRQKRAFGTGGGALGRALGVGATAAKRAPLLVLALTLVVSAAGAYGATQVDTSFAQEDFLADDPPAWMDRLPAPFEPGEYHAKDSLTYVYENFRVQGAQGRAQLLVEAEGGGGVASADLLHGMSEVHARAATQEFEDVVVVLPSDRADVRSPLAVMRAVAASDESYGAAFAAADTDGDGVPERNVTALYDRLYEVAPQAASGVLYREAGDYRAARMVVSVQGSASGDAVTDGMRDLADELAGPDVTVTATGQPIVFKLVSDSLLSTVVQSLLITLVAVFCFLMVTYRVTDGSATLGFVTLLPVAFSVSWILGTMYLLEIPFNVLTGMITSLTVGLGVAYSIHVSERYAHELERQGDTWAAMETTVTGTGGALLGSAATTVGGFGVLGFAILPPLRQFGIITGLTIIYAFLASVLVLPTLLAFWTRYVGPTAGGGRGTDPDGAAGGSEDAADEAESDEEELPGAVGATETHEDGATAGGASGEAPSDGRAGPAEEPGDTASDPPGGERVLTPPYVEPGGTLDVTVSLQAHEGRVVLRETVAGADVTIDRTRPAPTDAVADGDTAFVAWDLDAADPAPKVRYLATVPETARHEDRYSVDGTVRTGAGEVPVDGADAATVVPDLFERILSNGEVTTADLRAAARRLESGDLTRRQYERVTAEWLRRRDGESGEGPDDTPAGAE